MEQLKEDIDCFDPDTAPTLSDEVHVTHTHVINDDLIPIGTNMFSTDTRVSLDDKTVLFPPSGTSGD